jgi:S-adenosylmethionine:tRNA ribosyltransferase-isomerase
MTELDRYDYDLPRELIAQRPLPCRSDARMMVVDRATRRIEHCHVRDLPELLHPGDCLVLNQSRVIPARLVGRRAATGGRFTGLYLDSLPDGTWRLLGKCRGKLRPGEVIVLEALPGPRGEVRDDVELELLDREVEGVWQARPRDSAGTLEILERVGRVPLPPYIRRGEMDASDAQRYQTVYATQPGSVAAPTAGLHFTEELLARIAQRGVATVRVTLHVGLGTFRPIEAPQVEQHTMHAEWGELSDEAARALTAARQGGGRIVAVGTTCVRLLETAARCGTIAAWSGQTRLYICPGHEFRAVDAMLTNFHLPRSTLLVLVRTFGGDELIRAAYEEAIRQRYRFFSYGDAMFIV